MRSKFYKWLQPHAKYAPENDNPVGDLAYDVGRDPPRVKNLAGIEDHMSARRACPEAYEALGEAVYQFLSVK